MSLLTSAWLGSTLPPKETLTKHATLEKLSFVAPKVLSIRGRILEPMFSILFKALLRVSLTYRSGIILACAQFVQSILMSKNDKDLPPNQTLLNALKLEHCKIKRNVF